LQRLLTLRSLIITIILSILVPASYEPTTPLQEKWMNQQAIIVELQREIALVDDQMANREKELADLQKSIVELEHPNWTAAMDAGRQTGVELVINEQPWLRKFMDGTVWDKIVIADSVVISDSLFIEGINNLVCLQTTDTGRYPNGYRMYYTFEFYEGDETYTFDLIDQHAIQVDRHQLYLWPQCNLYRVIEAFMPAEPFVKHDGLIAKMAASGAIKRGEQYVLFAPKWVQLRIWPLLDGELLDEKPEHTGDRIERFTFYYHGDELYMDIYPQYVHLLGPGEELWLFLDDAEYILAGEPG